LRCVRVPGSPDPQAGAGVPELAALRAVTAGFVPQRLIGPPVAGGDDDAHEWLFEAALEDRGVVAVAQVLVDTHGGTAIVLDAALEIVAGVPSRLDAEVERRLGDALRARSGDLVEIFVGGSAGPALCGELTGAGRGLGWLVWIPAGRPTQSDLAALRSARLASSSVALREHAVEEVEERLCYELLRMLVGGTMPEIGPGAAAADHHAARRGCVAVVRPLRLDIASQQAVYRQTLSFGRAKGFMVARVVDGVVVIGPNPPTWPAELHRALTTGIGPAVVGVGPPADSTTGYEESFLLAGKAADALRAQQREGVLSLAESGLDQLIIEATDAGRLVGLVDETLEPLRRHDQERRSDLIHTLELAFEHGWNLQAAARAAHVHVSTLRYRLTKVEQLSGVDLTCPDDRLTVQLSIRLSKLLGCDSADRRTAAVTSSSTSSVAARTTDELQLD
jgi:hypothetical protein